MKTVRRRNALLLGLLGALCFAGCGTVPRNPTDSAAWFSTRDLDACEALARSAAVRDFPAIPLAKVQPAIIRVENWRECRFTVYLPMDFPAVASNDMLFLSFSFSNSVPYESDADVYTFAGRTNGKMVLTEERILPMNPTVLRRAGYFRE